MARKEKIRVMIVDDSALIRKLLSEILSSDDEIEVVGTANDPYIARNKIKKLNPDVLTLDVEMPKMNGINFLKNIMRLRPMPVIMVSSLTQPGAELALEALGLGAVDYVGKPDINSSTDFNDYAREIIEKVKVAADMNYAPDSTSSVMVHSSASRQRTPHAGISHDTDSQQVIVAIGASTGGTEAIKEILTSMQPDAYSIVIVQHIPKAFSKSFSDRIDSMSALKVHEASHGQEIVPGNVYIAPGDQHLRVIKKQQSYFCELDDGAPYNRHKPSVDILFRSVSETAGKHAVGILLTGMGSDGACGLKEMHENGSITIAQDEASSIVWGMPGEAVKLNAANYILPLGEIPEILNTLIQNTD